ncbi:MAG: NUDIX hydrolase [Chlamydiae bacterium]|nr:NUDIX hydrolase [Chlamydiota bacterium]
MSTTLSYEVYREPPLDFHPTMQVVSCYLEIEGKLLLLQRGPHQSYSGCWGVPAGKVEKGESFQEAAIRELYEETGIQITASQTHDLGSLYIRKPHVNYIYRLFQIQLETLPKVQAPYEKHEHLWASFKELSTLPLIASAEEALQFYYEKTISKQKPYLCVYLILEKDNEVLLLLRKNTGYGDGYYSLIAGHVDNRESATQAMLREAYEEAGVVLSPKHLQVVHVSHRYSNRYNVDIFFKCTTWEGSPLNKEPDKCEHLRYFPLNSLPGNLLPELKKVFVEIEKGSPYSEEGFLK